MAEKPTPSLTPPVRICPSSICQVPAATVSICLSSIHKVEVPSPPVSVHPSVPAAAVAASYEVLLEEIKQLKKAKEEAKATIQAHKERIEQLKCENEQAKATIRAHEKTIEQLKSEKGQEMATSINRNLVPPGSIPHLFMFRIVRNWQIMYHLSSIQGNREHQTTRELWAKPNTQSVVKIFEIPADGHTADRWLVMNHLDSKFLVSHTLSREYFTFIVRGGVSDEVLQKECREAVSKKETGTYTPETLPIRVTPLPVGRDFQARN
eukprot:TRINITY_DN5385_c0_g2_i1.p1 TRINITY_DN5385_c0_g2~~TRINITY_DN5385_c0_g2_i1.p1  ORF type:complete len:265 (-),score=-12.99 TRINITY_DN5385_c0_g2_i1:106-900(-)